MCLNFGGIFDDIISRLLSQREVFLCDSIVLYLHRIAGTYDHPILTSLEQGGVDSVHHGQSNISVYIRDPGDGSSDTFRVICGSRHRYLLFCVLDRILECY